MIFKLNQSAGQPVYLQIVDQVRHAISGGVLADGDCLPAIRTLAQELVVSPNTIAKAYPQLEHEGFTSCRVRNTELQARKEYDQAAHPAKADTGYT